MTQISSEKFGVFLCQLRKKHNMTQKELADKLYVSDKTVSKWERGASFPNIVLLIPIADLFGITVTELLQGERVREKEEQSLRLEILKENENRRRIWKVIYVICFILAAIETGMILRLGYLPGQMGDLFVGEGILFLFAGWLCFYSRDLLPAYYDENRIDFVSQGIFRIHMTGVAFHNGNWPHITKIIKGFTLGVSVSYPVVFYISGRMEQELSKVPIKQIYLLCALSLMTGLLYYIGKKYE